MEPLRRRMFLVRLGSVGTIAAASVFADPIRARSAPESGRIKQSVCRWPYSRMPLPEFCRRTKQIGFAAIDLLYPDEWSAAADAGLVVSMGYASRREKFIATGFNDPANHALLLGELEAALPLAAQARVPNVIAMFGNRVAGIDDNAAIANCVAGLAQKNPLAQKLGGPGCGGLPKSQDGHSGLPGEYHALCAAGS